MRREAFAGKSFLTRWRACQHHPESIAIPWERRHRALESVQPIVQCGDATARAGVRPKSTPGASSEQPCDPKIRGLILGASGHVLLIQETATRQIRTPKAVAQQTLPKSMPLGDGKTQAARLGAVVLTMCPEPMEALWRNYE